MRAEEGEQTERAQALQHVLEVREIAVSRVVGARLADAHEPPDGVPEQRDEHDRHGDAHGKRVRILGDRGLPGGRDWNAARLSQRWLAVHTPSGRMASAEPRRLVMKRPRAAT